jgi:predicted chitinase
MTAAGATLTAPTQTVYNPMNLYSMPTMQEVSTEIKDYLRGTAIDDAMREALNLPEVYQGAQTEEEPDPNITDPDVLRDALQPEPITVEELPDVITKAGDTLSAIAASVDLPLQAVIDANPQIANPDMIRPGQKINMPSRQVTSEERTALSNVDEITRAQIANITDTAGAFSNTELSNAIAGSVKNPTKQSVLKGAIEIETGGDGPVTEDNTYSIKAAKAVWTGVDAVLATLPADVASRLQYDYDNNLPRVLRTASQEDMQLLGEAMMEEKYDGGAAYKGRGLIQITGKSTYKEVEDVLKSKGIDVDLVANPELINDPEYALPAALAYLEYVGLDGQAAEDMTAKELNNKINRGAGSAIAEERWEAVVSSLRQSGENEKADELELRNEYAAQEKAGLTGRDVDGAIGPDSRRALRAYLRNENVAVPANITDDELVVLVNKN